METISEILNEIEKYSEWSDKDTTEDLKIYLDTIHELANDAIELLIKKENDRDRTT